MATAAAVAAQRPERDSLERLARCRRPPALVVLANGSRIRGERNATALGRVRLPPAPRRQPLSRPPLGPVQDGSSRDDRRRSDAPTNDGTTCPNWGAPARGFAFEGLWHQDGNQRLRFAAAAGARRGLHRVVPRGRMVLIRTDAPREPTRYTTARTWWAGRDLVREICTVAPSAEFMRPEGWCRGLRRLNGV